MDQPHPMRLGNPQRGLAHHDDLLLQRELVAELGQRSSRDVLHRDVDAAADFAHLIDLADSVVVHTGLRARFCQHPSRLLGVFAKHELDRDLALEPEIARQKYLAHATLAEQADRIVAIPARNGKLVNGRVGVGRRNRGRTHDHRWRHPVPRPREGERRGVRARGRHPVELRADRGHGRIRDSTQGAQVLEQAPSLSQRVPLERSRLGRIHDTLRDQDPDRELLVTPHRNDVISSF